MSYAENFDSILNGNTPETYLKQNLVTDYLFTRDGICLYDIADDIISYISDMNSVCSDEINTDIYNQFGLDATEFPLSESFVWVNFTRNEHFPNSFWRTPIPIGKNMNYMQDFNGFIDVLDNPSEMSLVYYALDSNKVPFKRETYEILDKFLEGSGKTYSTKRMRSFY